MKKKKKTPKQDRTTRYFDFRTLKTPAKPQDTVYFVLEDNTISPSVARTFGIRDNGRCFASCDGAEYDFGIEDGLFFTKADAQKFIDSPSSFDDSYGTIDWKPLGLPFEPGKIWYYCDYDPYEGGWEIFKEYYDYVIFDNKGNVSVGNGEGECTKIGKDILPCFLSRKEAEAYIQSHPSGD